MKNRNSWVWIAFACCDCLVLAAMLWLTRSVIATERDRAAAEIRAELQERVRLALWRMDVLGTSILLEENAIPTPLFLSEPETTLPVMARFESPDGLSIKGTGQEQNLEICRNFLPKLDSIAIASREPPDSPKKISESYKTHFPTPESKIRGTEKMQQAANMAEKANRVRFLGDALSKQNPSYAAEFLNQPQDNSHSFSTHSNRDSGNSTSDFKPIWDNDSLFLIRQGRTMKSFAQGSLVDLRKLKSLLLSEIKPLLPTATLTKTGGEADESFALASFPLLLVPGKLGAIPGSISRPIFASLLVGWLAAMVALLAAFFLISNIMKLSERRASFVSTVTHELRTPLTTFRLYSDMLSSGAVREEKKPAYLAVLSREADRLSLLVENVLAFSQIERGSARSAVSEIELGELIESMRERFETRLEAVGLTLLLRIPEPIHTSLDTSALEHILFNLIDNAAKYAANSAPPEVRVEAFSTNGKISIEVSDNGPGIAPAERKRIFRAFHKSAKQAAETKPGVGLGLALSQRLAIAMGGSLRTVDKQNQEHGAAFRLNLPSH